MPQIPEFRESPDQVPVRPFDTEINPGRMGQDAESLAKLGGEFADFGNKLAGMQKKAEEEDAMAQKSQETRDWYAKRAIELSTKDPTGFADQLHTELLDRLNQDLDGMPTGDSAREYKNRMGEYASANYASAYAHQQQNKVKEFENNFDSRVQNSANKIMNTYPMSAYSMMKSEAQFHDEFIKGSTGTIINPTEADEKRQKMMEKLATGLFDNFEKDRKSAAMGIHIIDNVGKDGNDGFLSRAMSADELATRRRRLEVISRQGDEMALRDLNQKKNNLLERLGSLDEDRINSIQPGEEEAVISGLENLSKGPNPLVTPQQVNEARYEMAMARGFANAGKLVENASPEDIQKNKDLIRKSVDDLVKKYGGVPSDTALGDKFEDKFDGYVANVMNERAKDPQAYIDNHFKDMPPGAGYQHNGIPTAEYIEERVAKQDAIHLNSNWLLSKPEREMAVLHYKRLAENNPDQAATELMALGQHKYGREITQELVDQGKLPEYLKIASQMDNREAALSVVNNFKPDRKKELNDFAEKRLDSAQRLDLRSSVNTEMGKYFGAMAAAGKSNKSTEAATTEAVRLEALAQMDGTGLSSKEAAKAAYDKVIGNNFHVVGTAMVPKRIGDTITSPQMIQEKMNEYHYPDVWKKEGIPGDPSNLNLRWRTDPRTGNGAYLQAQDRGDKSQWHDVTHSDQTPVYVDFKDATLHQSPEQIARRKGFWGKVWEDAKDSISGPAIPPSVDPMDSFKGNRSPQSTGGAIVEEIGPPTNYQSHGITYAPSGPGSIEQKIRSKFQITNLPNALKGEAAEASEIHQMAPSKPLPEGVQMGNASDTLVERPIGEKYLPVTSHFENKFSIPSGILHKVLAVETGPRHPVKIGKDTYGGDFNPKAVSPAGAKGLGQFTDATGVDYGLVKVSKGATFDEKGRLASGRILADHRTEPRKTIEASARYLSDLNKQFDGDWTATVAAYNNGPGNVQKGIKRFGSIEKYLSATGKGAAPQETKDYVKRIIGG